jgi:hypothetical protein
MDEEKDLSTSEQEEKDEQLAERTKLSKRIKAFKATAESGADKPSVGLTQRKARYQEIDSYHIERKHWSDDEDRLLPRIPLTFYHTDSLNADIGKRPHDPKVVAETAQTFPGEWENMPQWLQSKQKLQEILQERYKERSDNEIAADFFTAILDVYREKACIDPQRATARLIKLQYGDVFWHNGYDPEKELFGKCPHFVDVFKPEKVGADPKATRWVGNDFNGMYAFLEIETTLRQLKKDHPKTAKEIVVGDEKKSGGDESLDPLDQTINKYLFYIRDTELVDDEEDYEEEVPVLIDGMLVPQRDDAGFPVLDEQGQPIPMTQTVVKQRPIKVPKYPSGWLYAVWCNDKVLDFGPADEFGIHRDYCYEIPGQVFAHGVVDVASTFNTQANRLWQQIIKSNESTGSNKVFRNTQAAFSNAEKALKDTDVIDVEGPLQGNIEFHQGVPAPEGLFRALEFTLQACEQVTGNVDPMSQENLPRTASGKYVYAAESGQQARISEVAKHSDECERSLYRSIIRQSLKYDTDEMTLKVNTAGQKLDVPFTPNTLYTQDFDIRWDVSLDGAPQESPDPAERNEQRKTILAELSQMPPTIAFGTLEQLDIPNKEGIRATLEKWFQEQADQPPPSDPVEQAKASGQAAKDFTQSMQDAAKTLQEAGYVSQGVGLMLWAVMESRKIANGQDPDFTFVENLFTTLGLPSLGFGGEPQAEDPAMADPMLANPLTGGFPQ